MKRIFFLLILVVTCSSTAYATAGEELQSLLNGVSTMTANFTEMAYGGHKAEQQSSGTMELKKPGFFNWEVTSPSKIVMISNGRLIWYYDKALSQVTITPIKKNQNNSPAVILSNRIQLLSNYFIVWKKNGWFYLNPRYKNDSLKQVQLKFQGQLLVSMRIFDNLGQRIYINFNNVKVNIPLSSSRFKFSFPKGADTIKNP